MDTQDKNSDLLKPITQSEQVKKTTSKKQNEKRYTPISPVPENAPSFTKLTPEYHNTKFQKAADHIYDYTLADGSLVMKIVRWNDVKQGDGTTKKEMRPFIYGKDGAGNTGWYSQFADAPLPLYRLPDFAKRTDLVSGVQGILFVEGEKAAEAGQILFPLFIVTTTAGGSNAAHKTDFLPVRFADVLISPDCGHAGAKYGDVVYKYCRKAGAGSIQKFDTQALSNFIIVDGIITKRTEPAKPNYDLADALEDGWTAELMGQHREQFVIDYIEQDCEIIGEYKLTETSVWKAKKEKGIITGWTWICPHIKVSRQVRDKKGRDWSRVVTFLDPQDNLKTEVITNEMLAGDGKELRVKLAGVGFSILPRAYNRAEFNEYIYFSSPREFATSVKKVGWYDEGVYILPDKIYGSAEAQEEYVQHLKFHHTPTIEIKGDLKGWQENVAMPAVGNSRLIMSIVNSLTPPFLTPLEIEGYIFNLYGNSSTGKSSALWVASSVSGYEMLTFLNTNNAFESVFVAHNDGCVVIDEMGNAKPEKLGEFVYTAINGKTKGRCNQFGDRSIEPISFRVNGLVSSEMTLAGKMAEARQKTTAGQEVRFMDIVADAGKGFGIFENTHGKTPQELADSLRRASTKYKGTALNALLEYLTSQTWEKIAQALNPAIEAFKVRHLETTLKNQVVNGQVRRSLEKFALQSSVGEFCIKIDILPWESGTVLQAYDALFREWLDNRGNSGDSRELTEVIENINKLCQQEISRFDVTDGNDDLITHAIDRKRAGVIKTMNGEQFFCVFPDVFKSEVMGGKDRKIIIPELVKRGMLKIDSTGGADIKTRIRNNERSTRMYHLIPASAEGNTENQGEDMSGSNIVSLSKYGYHM